MKSLCLGRSASVVAAELLLAGAASAAFIRGGGMKIGPVNTTLLDGTDGDFGWGTFEQLIDHSNPSLGTFQQRYWYGTPYWKGPGSPIIFITPGEQSADGFNVTYTTTQRLPGLFAQQVGGANIVLEHRYWGESSPFEELTVENLQYLTLDNSLKDLTYFAQNFVPPFDPSGKSSPQEVPWIYSGGSYPGALAGWLEAKDPGTFWAYHGTSGVVEAIQDFWTYFAPVVEATPANCTADLNAVIDYIDATLVFGLPEEKAKLKDLFMLGDLEDVDFVSALEYGPWSWQDTQFYMSSTGTYNPYYQFCDYVENAWPNSTSPIPGPEGVGLEKALAGYAKWFTEIELPGTCESAGYADWQGEYNTGCFANLNASNPVYKDLTVGNWVNRQWNWMLCNEPFGWWQDGPPLLETAIVSRLVDPAYWQYQCELSFPLSEGGYGSARGKTPTDVNLWTGGWSVTNTTRLMYANGQFDPWRDSTVSSDYRPFGPLASTPELPVRVIPGGVHCSDLYQQNWAVNPELQSIVNEEVANIVAWVDEFYTTKNKTKP